MRTGHRLRRATTVLAAAVALAAAGTGVAAASPAPAPGAVAGIEARQLGQVPAPCTWRGSAARLAAAIATSTDARAAAIRAALSRAGITAATSVGSCAATPPTGASSPAPAGAGRFQVGIVGSSDPLASQRLAELGAHVMRDEFSIDTNLDDVAKVVDAAAANKVRLQPLIGWENGQPAPDLTGLAQWAKTFGPGGTHWAGKSDAYAITDIELGNENAFSYKSGDADSSGYTQLAEAYGTRALAAAKAIDAANPAVKVLLELDSGDTDNDTWITGVMKTGGTELTTLMRGPTIHPYGPDWQQKVDQDRKLLLDHGVDKPFYLTEWGISTDNGDNIGDNYGYPTTLTYDAAGAALTTAVTEMAAMPDAIAQLLIYQLGDQQDPGRGEREFYFGVLNSSGGDKGGYTAAIRAAIKTYG